ncbi:hypothetical protein Nstercoris_00125 [Nitrosomonas stercoris]|uniref:Addiction module component n=1 Tax=Nitrosomonas stercoris TaxID=1444684 RepID=A0A4Y1YJI5_9PROT|nr:hypothetical protein Nstercoris_00125 [Nitrosomonas stercoris]
MDNVTIDYRSLDISERLELVADIWDSIAEETNGTTPMLSAEQRQELQRRLTAHRNDPSSSISWKEVRKQLFSKENS